MYIFVVLGKKGPCTLGHCTNKMHNCIIDMCTNYKYLPTMASLFCMASVFVASHSCSIAMQCGLNKNELFMRNITTWGETIYM